MVDVLIYGASGHAGRAVLGGLVERGVRCTIAGRDREKLRAVVCSRGAGMPALCVAANDGPGLRHAIVDSGCAIVVNCAGPSRDIGTSVVEAALAAGVHYVDISTEPTFLLGIARAFSARHGPVVAAGCGARGSLADWAADLLSVELGGLDEVEIAYGHAAAAYLRPSVGYWLAAAGEGFYRQASDGTLPIRREFDFPPPFGRGTALWTPGPEEVAVGARGAIVRCHAAFAPGTTANEVWSRWESATGPFIPGLAKLLLSSWGRFHMKLYFPGPDISAPFERPALAIVVEARRGRWSARMGIVGTNLYSLTAATVALCVERIAGGCSGAAGAVSPAGLVGGDHALRYLERAGVLALFRRDLTQVVDHERSPQ